MIMVTSLNVERDQVAKRDDLSIEHILKLRQ